MVKTVATERHQREYIAVDYRRAATDMFIGFAAFSIPLCAAVTMWLVATLLLGMAVSHYYRGHSWAWEYSHLVRLCLYGFAAEILVVTPLVALLWLVFLGVRSSWSEHLLNAKALRILDEHPAWDGHERRLP